MKESTVQKIIFSWPVLILWAFGITAELIFNGIIKKIKGE